MRTALLILALVAGIAGSAQDTTRTWDLNGSLLTILYNDTIALWNPSLSADHNNLHLEARYQWEDWNTGSVWAGRWFGFGDALHVDLAPMVGGVFGNINGVAPGLLIEAEWKRLSFYSSSEYFIDLQEDGDFAYTWSEIAFDTEVLLVGVVAQRTRTFDSPLELQRGLLLVREQGGFTFGAYIFNFFYTDPTLAFNLSYDLQLPRKPHPTSP